MMAEVSIKQTIENDVYGNMANFTSTPENSKPKRRNGMTVFFMSITIWNIFLFVLVAGALALSIYASLDKNQAVCSPCFNAATTAASMDDVRPGTAAQVQELNDTIAELKAQIDQLYTSLEDRYNALNASVVSAVQSVETVVPTNQVDLYAGCVEDTAECIIDHSDVGSQLPGRASCDTLTLMLVLEGYTNTDMFCSIDNSVGETNPITSSLNIIGGGVSCLCSLVALATPIGDPVCKLQIRRCPNTIRLNTTTIS